MGDSYLTLALKSLQNGRRFSDSGPSYLEDVKQLIEQGLYNNTTERQRDEQRKIEAYLKVYGDDPRLVESLIEKYLINQIPNHQQIKTWY